MPVWRSNPCARSQQQPRLAVGPQCLPGGPVRVPRTMLPGSRGPRRVAPVRRAGRSASTLLLNRPPRPGVAEPDGGWISGRCIGAPLAGRRYRARLGTAPVPGPGSRAHASPAARHAHPPQHGEAMHAGAARLRGPWGEPAAHPRGWLRRRRLPWPRGEQRTAMFPPRPLATGAPALLHPGSCCGRYHTGRQARRAVLPRR